MGIHFHFELHASTSLWVLFSCPCSPSVDSCVPLTHPHHLLLQLISRFAFHFYSRRLLYIFMVIRNQDLGVRVIQYKLILLQIVLEQCEKMHVCILSHIQTGINKGFCISISNGDMLNMCFCWSLQLISFLLEPSLEQKEVYLPSYSPTTFMISVFNKHA